MSEIKKEPYSIDYPARDSDACIRYAQMVTNAYAAWSIPVATKPAFRNSINNTENRELFGRLSVEEVIAIYGTDEELKAVLENEGLLGNTANLNRIANDRPHVVDDNIETVLPEQTAQVSQMLKQATKKIDIFY